MNSFGVRTTNYFQFRKLLKICYKLNYRFRTDHGPLSLWVFWGCKGVYFEDFGTSRRMLWLDTKEEQETEITYKQFIKELNCNSSIDTIH
jgi:hypothetical protein